MHGCDWGVDLSLWWGPINGCVQNLNPSFHRRHLLMSHVAGAHTIAVEGVDILLGPNSTLSPLAAALDDYGAFLLKHPWRPNPDVPVAIMIAADQGKPLQPHHSLTITALTPLQASVPRLTGPPSVAASHGTSGRCFRNPVTALLKGFSVISGRLLLLHLKRFLGVLTCPMTRPHHHLL